MKKRTAFEIIYWLASIIVLASIFKSGCRSFPIAFLYASHMLPSLLMAAFLHKQLTFEDMGKGIKHTFFLGAGILATSYFGFCLCGWYLNKYSVDNIFMLNPVLLLFIVVSFAILHRVLHNKLFAGNQTSQHQEQEFIEFTSERKKITLEISKIMYVESNDSEVWVRCSDNASYRTKMNISNWEGILGSRFERIHRSFLVNKEAVTCWETYQVHIGDTTLPVSRKYRK